MDVVKYYFTENTLIDQPVLFFHTLSNVDLDDVAGHTFNVGMPDPSIPVETREISSNLTFSFDETDTVTIERGSETIDGQYEYVAGVIRITFEEGDTQFLDITEFTQEQTNDRHYYVTLDNINLDNEDVALITRHYLIYNTIQDQLLLFYKDE